MIALYDVKRKVKGQQFVSTVVGGREVKLFSFHFPPVSYAFQNISPSSNFISFIDGESIYMRKWTVKAALLVRESKFSIPVQNSDCDTFRSFFSFCQLVNLTDPLDPLNYILLSILTTFNPLFRYEFLVWNKHKKCVERYYKFQFIQHYRCDLNVDVSKSIIFYRRVRDEYFSSKKMLLGHDESHNASYVPIIGLPFTFEDTNNVTDEESGKRKKVKLM